MGAFENDEQMGAWVTTKKIVNWQVKSNFSRKQFNMNCSTWTSVHLRIVVSHLSKMVPERNTKYWKDLVVNAVYHLQLESNK